MLEAIRKACSKIVGSPIKSLHPLNGGNINEAFLFKTDEDSFFIKLNRASFASDMLQKEAKGLALLANTNSIRIPNLLACDKVNNTAFLFLEYIDPGIPTPLFWKNFGQQLAQLHRHTSTQFGLDHDNYIGNLVQVNGKQNDWVSFFIKERLQVQIDLAKQSKRIPSSVEDAFYLLYKKLSSICPNEPPSLTHGDLWNGNFICTRDLQAVLIDPAVSYAHREIDLAMTMLFGGFPSTFYEAYNEAFPLEKGFIKRVEIYQLYYLMVHVNIFGGVYLDQVKAILKKFV